MKLSSRNLIPNVDLIKNRKHNALSNDKWVFINKKSSEPYSINLASSEFNISERSMLWLKSSIRINFTSLTDGYILANEDQIKKFLIVYMKIIRYSEKSYPNLRLEDWSVKDLENLVVYLLYSKSESASSTQRSQGSKLISKKTFESYLQHINNIHQGYIRGLCDGFPFPLYHHRVFAQAQALIVEKGDDYGLWLAGGTWGRVPVEVAMLLLQHCLNTIRSPKTLVLRAMYRAAKQNGHQSYPPGCIKALNDHMEYRVKEGVPKHIAMPNSHGKLYKKYPELLLAANVELSELAENGNEIKEWPFPGQGEYFVHLKRVYSACLIIFLTVTGARWSELRKLKSDSIQKNHRNEYVFKSNIEKTNFGIETIRDITGLAAEAVDILLELSVFDKENDSSFLFDSQLLFSSKDSSPRYWSLTEIHGTTTEALNNFFGEFIETYPLFSELHPRITPHQFRHTFAEFALRRFDGNVIQAIREHFRHSFESLMTKDYTQRKVIENDLPVNLDREYISELIMRHVENEELLYGPVGAFIRNEVENLDIRSPEDARVLMDEFDDRLVVHEFGVCLIRLKTKALSKCWDKSTAAPNVKNANFALCSGCANRLSLGNHKEDIERLGYSAQGHLEFFDEAGVPLNQEYRNLLHSTVKNAASALKEWEK